LTDENITLKTAIASVEDIAQRHGLNPEDLATAVENGELRRYSPPEASPILVAERDVLVWMATHNSRFTL
jgi:S-adenosylmethionine:diacylglycerol 3-amino-3-carboxypropyl transferase